MLTLVIVTAMSAASAVAPMPSIVQDAIGMIATLSGTKGMPFGASTGTLAGTSAGASFGAPPSFGGSPPEMPLLLLQPNWNNAIALIPPSAIAALNNVRPGVFMRFLRLLAERRDDRRLEEIRTISLLAYFTGPRPVCSEGSRRARRAWRRFRAAPRWRTRERRSRDRARWPGT